MMFKFIPIERKQSPQIGILEKLTTTLLINIQGARDNIEIIILAALFLDDH